MSISSIIWSNRGIESKAAIIAKIYHPDDIEDQRKSAKNMAARARWVLDKFGNNDNWHRREK